MCTERLSGNETTAAVKHFVLLKPLQSVSRKRSKSWERNEKHHRALFNLSESPDRPGGSDIGLDAAIYQIASQRWKGFLQTQAGLRPNPLEAGRAGRAGEERGTLRGGGPGIRNFLKGSHFISWLTWL